MRIDLRTALLATAAFASVATPAAAESYFFRSKAAVVAARDLEPDPVVAFVDAKDVAPSADVLSAIRLVTGHDGAPIRISGTGGSYRVCADASCSAAGAWTSSPGTLPPSAYVQLKAVAGAAGETRKVTLTVGTQALPWSVATKAPCSGPTVTARSSRGHVVEVCGWSKAPTNYDVMFTPNNPYTLYLIVKYPSGCGDLRFPLSGPAGSSQALSFSSWTSCEGVTSDQATAKAMFTNVTGLPFNVTYTVTTVGAPASGYNVVTGSNVTWN